MKIVAVSVRNLIIGAVAATSLITACGGADPGTPADDVDAVADSDDDQFDPGAPVCAEPQSCTNTAPSASQDLDARVQEGVSAAVDSAADAPAPEVWTVELPQAPEGGGAAGGGGGGIAVDAVEDTTSEAAPASSVPDVQVVPDPVDAPETHSHVTPPECADPVSASTLNAIFDNGLDTLVGMDYQRAFQLNDGRVLWVFQDAFVADAGDSPKLIHNAAALQDGTCFTEHYGGSASNPSAWLAAAETQSFSNWYWPMGGTQTSDTTFLLYVAEMSEEGSHYLDNATPMRTWTVEVDLETLEAGPLQAPVNASEDLYGWAVTSDETHTYLFAHCYRQFGFGELIGHDTCTSDIKVARHLHGDSELLEYWNGSEWTQDSEAATNIAPLVAPDGKLRGVNPMQIQYVDGQWMSVTKYGDWFGHTVYLEKADSPTGPWETVATLQAETLGPEKDFNTYFASFIPDAASNSDPNSYTIGISNNRWDGRHSAAYRPTFFSVAKSLFEGFNRFAANASG